MKTINSQGQRFFGMHFYPGVAQYSQAGKQPLMVFLNEDTIRKMDKTFEGKPVFVQHVDEVSASLDKLKNEADGWVVKSFYNEADGKHWVEFIIVSEKGLEAIKSGMRLSNAYLQKGPSGPSGMWNGVEYDRQINDGEYEHLAIVPTPRYDESIVKTPDGFKAYNDALRDELKRVTNSTTQGEIKMKLNIFTKKKVENDLNLENYSVELPKSKKEKTINELVELADKIENMHGYADMNHLVKMNDESEMSVGDLHKKYHDAMAEMAKMKESKEGEMENDEEEDSTVASGEEDVGDRGGDKALENKEEMEAAEAKKKNAADKAKRLTNAGPHNLPAPEAPAIITSADRVALGKKLF